MRVLVTGSAGNIGREQARVLREAGHEVITFDRFAKPKDQTEPHIVGDIRDIYTARRAVESVDAVLHLGAIPSDRGGSGEDLLETNVQGTWNLLIACAEAGVGRFVNFSSVNALGCVGGREKPKRFPIEDAYPRHPNSPYQLSKHLGEETCTYFSARHGMITISLRPVFVAAPDHYAWLVNDGNRFGRDWAQTEFWAYVDRRDVCAAGLLALTVEGVQNAAFLLTADDTTRRASSQELIAEFYPETPWIVDKDAYFAENPHRSLFDCTHAKEVLGWQPQYSWRNSSPISEKE